MVFCYWYFCVLNLLESPEVPISVRYDSLVDVSLQNHPDYPLKLSKWNNRDIFPTSKLPNILFSHQSSVHSICAIRGSIRPNLKNLQHHHGAFPKLLSNCSLIPQCYKKRRKLDLVWQSYNFEFLLKSSKLAYLLFASSLQLCHARDFTRTICK